MLSNLKDKTYRGVTQENRKEEKEGMERRKTSERKRNR